jgi:cytochrome c556
MRVALCSVALVSAVMAVAGAVSAHEGATGVLKERMDAMKDMAQVSKAISQAVKDKRGLDDIPAQARSIQQLAAKMADQFPRGSDTHPSEAKPAIWKNWSDFLKKAQALEAEAARLASASPEDLKALTTQARRVIETCSACHEAYRATRRH